MKVTHGLRDPNKPFFGGGGVIIPFGPRKTSTPAKEQQPPDPETPSTPKSDSQGSNAPSPIPPPPEFETEVREQLESSPSEEPDKGE